MKAYFRVDASTILGSGHVMRCLTLAGELRAAGCEVLFICRNLPGNLAAQIQTQRFAVELMPELTGQSDWQRDVCAVKQVIAARGETPDWLIVDNYALDWQWEQAMRPYCRYIMVIDDLADRKHICDLLLDQNYYTDMRARYGNLVPENCRLLLGPQYALLRPEFVAARKNLPAAKGDVHRMLVFFGGSDSANETMKALQALEMLKLPGITVDVVVGSSNPHRKAVQEVCRHMMPGCVFHCQINNMAELMARADLAIGAGGSASWERCYLELPAIGIAVADNQERLLTDLAEFGAIVGLGRSEKVTPSILADNVRKVFMDNQLRETMRRKCRELMSKYTAGAVSAVLMEGTHV